MKTVITAVLLLNSISFVGWSTPTPTPSPTPTKTITPFFVQETPTPCFDITDQTYHLIEEYNFATTARDTRFSISSGFSGGRVGIVTFGIQYTTVFPQSSDKLGIFAGVRSDEIVFIQAIDPVQIDQGIFLIELDAFTRDYDMTVYLGGLETREGNIHTESLGLTVKNQFLPDRDSEEPEIDGVYLKLYCLVSNLDVSANQIIPFIQLTTEEGTNLRDPRTDMPYEGPGYFYIDRMRVYKIDDNRLPENNTVLLPTPSPIVPTPIPPPTPQPPFSFGNSIRIEIPNLPEDAIPLELTFIEPGSYMRGGNEDHRFSGRSESELPHHHVTISKGFYVGLHEVTQAQFESIMGTNPSYQFGQDGQGEQLQDYPVNQVTWFEALEYCNRLNELMGFDPVYSENGEEFNFHSPGFRLPTEAEFEYMMRAGVVEGGSWGNYKLHGPCGLNRIFQNVGSFLPNEWGIYDISTSVWEWCNDTPSKYPSGSVTDPLVFSVSGSKIIRGGGSGEGWDCNPGSRASRSSVFRDYLVGFRVVFSPPEVFD